MSDKTILTHFNSKGEARMVDVGNKAMTKRMAIAKGEIKMQKKTFDMIIQGDHKKGDVLSIARIAGIMAAKKTSELVPLCHPIMLTKIEIELTPNAQENSIQCRATTETTERTGVEMEALTAVQVTLLTIYDMCKAVDKGMVMQHIQLQHKSGGKSGKWSCALST